MPEWNLRDITEPGSDYLLYLLKLRATKSLLEQYAKGINDGPGDHDFITNSMLVNNLRHVNVYKHDFTVFTLERNYGRSFQVSTGATYEETMASLSAALNARLCFPQSTGELILERQLYLLQALNILVEDILEVGSTSRDTKKPPNKPEKAARDALSRLSVVSTPDKFSVQDLLASALDQKSSLEEYLELCRAEPVFFVQLLNNWFFRRPELIKDEKGQTMPLLTDKYISIAIFEMIHNAVSAVAIWDYLSRLLQLLINEPKDRIYRSITLQEISNTCHLEYGRVQTLFKRHVQSGSGFKYFSRISGVYDNGIARVSIKIKPELLMRENPQLHHMLELCQPQNTAPKAVIWIKKIDALHQSHPIERENMKEREFESFSDLVVMASFVQSLSKTYPLPPVNVKKGQIYGSRSKELASELDSLKTQIDLSDFAVPINNLLEQGMTDGALNALNGFIIDMTGTKMEFLYEDLIESCVSDIDNYHQQKKKTTEQNAKTELELLSTIPSVERSTPEVRVQQRRLKDKFRPAHSSIFEIALATHLPTPIIEPLQNFQVKQDTANVFSTLFSRAEARGSISWTGFEAAMADLKFSVMPKSGSIFTFFPPDDMKVQRPVTLHRPHKARIDGI